MFDIVKRTTKIGKKVEKHVLVTDRAVQGDQVLSGPWSSESAAQRYLEQNFAQTRTLLTGESLRIHAANGAYLFSVRQTETGPETFHDRLFSQQADEYAVVIELYPWNKAVR